MITKLLSYRQLISHFSNVTNQSGIPNDFSNAVSYLSGQYCNMSLHYVQHDKSNGGIDSKSATSQLSTTSNHSSNAQYGFSNAVCFHFSFPLTSAMLVSTFFNEVGHLTLNSNI